jgi:hypothetical protein
MNDLQKDGVMSDWNQIGALKVAAELREFIEKEALPAESSRTVCGARWTPFSTIWRRATVRF